MNPTIIKIIDLMFRGIPETEETAAIREELLTNSQARYDDLIAAGESPNTALGQVLDSLRGMEEVLDEYRNSQRTAAQPTSHTAASDPFEGLRRSAQAMGSQWEKATNEIENKLEHAASQLESQLDSFTDKAENAAKNAWDSAMEGFRSAMDSVRTTMDTASESPTRSMPTTGEENDGNLTYSFSADEVRRISVQLIGEDVEVTPSNDGRLHILIRQQDERLFLMENVSGTLTMRRNARFGTSTEETDEDTTGLGGILSGIGKALGSLFGYARTKADTVLLMLPHQMEQVTLQTASGDLEVAGLNQKDLALSTASGDIDITGCTADTARLHSTSGDLEVTGCTFGELYLNTTSGDVEMTADAQCLTANTTSGDLELTGQFQQMKINTVSGDVEADIQGRSLTGITANTVSGDVSVTLPEGITPRLETNTTSGSVSLCHGDPDSPVQVRINTVSGDIDVDNI